MSKIRTRIYKTDGIILKQIPFLEKDRIITIYSQEYGKLRLIAKGIRSPKSKFGGSLETLNSVSLSIIKRNSIDLITESYTNVTYLNIRNNLKLLSKSMYWIELIDSLTVENEPVKNMFPLTEFTLNLIKPDLKYGTPNVPKKCSILFNLTTSFKSGFFKMISTLELFHL